MNLFKDIFLINLNLFLNDRFESLYYLYNFSCYILTVQSYSSVWQFVLAFLFIIEDSPLFFFLPSCSLSFHWLNNWTKANLLLTRMFIQSCERAILSTRTPTLLKLLGIVQCCHSHYTSKMLSATLKVIPIHDLCIVMNNFWSCPTLTFVQTIPLHKVYPVIHVCHRFSELLDTLNVSTISRSIFFSRCILLHEFCPALHTILEDGLKVSNKIIHPQYFAHLKYHPRIIFHITAYVFINKN